MNLLILHIEEVDNTVEDEGYITLFLQELLLLLLQRQQFLVILLAEIFLNNDGSGYTSIPTVTFSLSKYRSKYGNAVAVTTSSIKCPIYSKIRINKWWIWIYRPSNNNNKWWWRTGAAATCSVGGTQI